MTASPGAESETTLQKGRGLNYVWLGLTVLLVLVGIVMVYSASSRLAAERYHNSFYFAQKQAAFALFGFFALMLFRYIPYQVYQRWVYWAMGASLLTLILVLIPGIGSRVGGASRWFRLGGVSFQPAEFSKLVLVIFLAYSMTKKQAVMKTLSQGYLFHVGVVLIFMALVLAEPDLGMAISILLLTGVLLFVGGVRLKHLLLSLVPLIPLAYFLVWRVPYRRLRVLSYLNPWGDPLGSGFHLIHSFYAFGAGGLTGQGLGESHQKLFYLPEPHTDFIFSILGEELGFLGVSIVAALFLFFMVRCLLLALRKKDLFGIYLTVGITVMIGLQAFINMLVVMGLLPTKGLTLPVYQLRRDLLASQSDLRGHPDEYFRPRPGGRRMKVLIAGGGTGGHLFPGIAIAETFMAQDPENQVHFISTRRAIDQQVLPFRGFPSQTIEAEGIKGRGMIGQLKALLKLPGALKQSCRILREFQPHLVIGVGGYVSGPVVLAGRLKGIPTAIQEQNSIPGLTNRILALLVDRILLFFRKKPGVFSRPEIVIDRQPGPPGTETGLGGTLNPPSLPDHFGAGRESGRPPA